MPDLGVAELSIRQADCPTGRLQHRMRVGREVVIEMGRARQCPGVVGPAGIDRETVEDGQQNGAWIHFSFTVRWDSLADHPLWRIGLE